MMYNIGEFRRQGLDELWVKVGIGVTARFLPVHSLVERIGPNLCQVLPAVHTLTGSDYTNKVGTKHVALLTNPQKDLKGFDSTANDLNNTIALAEEYLTQVQQKALNVKTNEQLRRDHLPP